jgi:hypothetical protein
MPATYRLTREYLSIVAPGLDPDDESDAAEMCEHFCNWERWREFLNQHDDQDLVAQYWREDEAYANDVFLQLTKLHESNCPMDLEDGFYPVAQ